jgi:hypothetical protein
VWHTRYEGRSLPSILEPINEPIRKEKMFTSFLVLLLKIISSPALLAGLIAFLQKLLNP